jgi:hypothetical protein
MILFPHDAYATWRGAYPAATVRDLMTSLARRWADGVTILEKIAKDPRRRESVLELAIARTCLAHFESVANQVEFYLLRDAAGSRNTARMIEIARREREIALRQFDVARSESLIGYEASNHYYYTPLDLMEKVLNCDQVLRELQRTRD